MGKELGAFPIADHARDGRLFVWAPELLRGHYGVDVFVGGWAVAPDGDSRVQPVAVDDKIGVVLWIGKVLDLVVEVGDENVNVAAEHHVCIGQGIAHLLDLLEAVASGVVGNLRSQPVAVAVTVGLEVGEN